MRLFQFDNYWAKLNNYLRCENYGGCFIGLLAVKNMAVLIMADFFETRQICTAIISTTKVDNTIDITLMTILIKLYSIKMFMYFSNDLKVRRYFSILLCESE